MAIQLKSARVERWPVAGEFVISRGASDHVDVVVAEVEEDGVAGRGEGTPIYYQGEDAAGCRDALLRVMPHLAGLGAAAARAAVQELMGAGAARNAIDCALWISKRASAGRRCGSLPVAKRRRRASPPSPFRSADPARWRREPRKR